MVQLTEVGEEIFAGNYLNRVDVVLFKLIFLFRWTLVPGGIVNYRIVDANQFSIYSAPIVCQKDSSFEAGSTTSGSDASGTNSLNSSVSLSASASMTESGKLKRKSIKKKSKKSKKKYQVLPDGVRKFPREYWTRKLILFNIRNALLY